VTIISDVQVQIYVNVNIVCVNFIEDDIQSPQDSSQSDRSLHNQSIISWQPGPPLEWEHHVCMRHDAFQVLAVV